SEKLSTYANKKKFLKERAFWQKIEFVEVPQIPKDFGGDDNYIKDARNESFMLDVEQTELLLTRVNEAFKTEINDVLLTMLAMGINKTFGHNRVLIALEGHGREEILEDINISRTLGWFTCVYPVLIEILHAGDLGRQIKEIKETLRQIPNKGIGYGILKYLTLAENKKEIEFKVKPEISFNYLGQFDADLRQISSFAIAKESIGNSQSPNNRREYVIDVTGMISNKRLTISFSYNEKHFKPETILALIRNFESELKRLIVFCCAKEIPERTPADFTFKGLSIETVDRLMKEYPHVEDIYTLTPMQEGLLFHALADDTSHSYFEQMSYRLHGQFDVDLIEKSLNELFKRHDVLRTAFVSKGIERPVQMVLKDRNIDFYYEDISQLRQRQEKENFIETFKKRDKDRSFDLNKEPLMRVAIFRIAESEFEFTWSYHHILMDGWCLGIINTEFFKIYTSYLANKPYRLPEVRPYRTYIQWLERLDSEKSARYWENYLDSFEEQTGIPRIEISTKQENRYKNETFDVELDKEKTASLNRLASGNYVTLNIVTQALWGILVGKYNGKEDVVFGTVVSGRPFELEGIESMVGLFINTIPVRIRFEERMKFNSLVRKTQEEALLSEPNHYHPLALIQARSNLKQNLFDHLYAFENYPLTEQLEGFNSADVSDKRNSLSFKLTNVDIFEQIHYDFNIVLAGADRLKITFRYNGNIYDNDYVERIAIRYCLLFDQIIENEAIELGDLIIISDLEKKQLLYDFNNTEAGYPKDKTIHQLFAEQAEHNPDGTAVVSCGHAFTTRTDTDNNMITYRQLHDQSDRLAALLIEKGVLTDSIVGIMMKRSLEMMAGIMSILKAGGAYLPIDPDYPQERIDYMLKDSGTLICLTDDEKKKITNCQLSIVKSQLSISQLRGPLHHSSFINHHSNHLAYIIYTSGTTGKPKGVLIEHGNVVRLLFNDRCLFDFNANDTWTMFHSYCFDFSVWEMYGALLYGGKLIIIPKIVSQDPQAFLFLLKKHQVTILNQTPSAFYNLITEEMKSPDQALDLRYVIFGGEALSPAKLKEWQKKYPGTKLINMFGITETTVHVTYKEITAKEIESGISCIGKPIPTLSTYIFNRDLKLVPIGTPGELCVGGRGVGRGYLNRPELSHEKFVSNSYKKHERLYKSGDQAKLFNDGEMEYLGRIDQQVQIRGFRVETGEIENRLLKHDDIRDAVVIAKKDKDSNIFLTAYIVSDIDLSISQLREFVANELPEYMIPAYFVRVQQIPLTLNGKLDKSKLPEPDVIRGEEYIPPANEIEEQLVVAWKEVLGLEKIGVEDNFFNIGGDSIKVIRLANSINNRLQTNIKILDLFTNNTVRELAQVIKNGVVTPHNNELAETEKEVAELKARIIKSGKMPEDVEDVFPMSDIEKGMIFHAYENSDEAIYHDQFVYHRKFPGFEPDIFRKALDLLTEKHSIL
ncbi:MAG TPA: amino acid adenylation domain-containing protein, partial [Candidatus Kapabacteria bacterium]|nr:amino acid adenylation domain-containing protein [Candidatus Kapabacteria bacterium]